MERLVPTPSLQTLLAARGVHPDPGVGYAGYVSRMEHGLRRLPTGRSGIVPTCMHRALGRIVDVARRWR